MFGIITAKLVLCFELENQLTFYSHIKIDPLSKKLKKP